jgi:hypothetical protein
MMRVAVCDDVVGIGITSTELDAALWISITKVGDGERLGGLRA